MIDFITGYFTLTNLAIYTVLSTLPVWATIFACRKLQGNQELNDKYWVFARTDYKNWGYLKCAIINFVVLFPLRYATAWFCVFSFTTIVVILMLGHKQG
jgi:hypothetical protein